MVIVKLLGGLGNQMFQYATGRAVASRLDVELLLDVSAFAHYDLRRYELDDWNITARLATSEELARSGVAAAHPSFFDRIARFLRIDLPVNCFREASFTYDPRILEVSSPVYLDGYWQSERYFLDIEKKLRQEFQLKASIDANNHSFKKKIDNLGKQAVSLHVRRGDYVTNAQTASYHGVCSLDYYRAAVNYIAEQVSDPCFFVFSDDLEWVQTNLNIKQPIVLVDANGPDKGAADMALMMACRHHIIANSSFSWWGSWLNPLNDKIIVAPKKWFGRANHDTTDLIPDSWVRL